MLFGITLGQPMTLLKFAISLDDATVHVVRHLLIHSGGALVHLTVKGVPSILVPVVKGNKRQIFDKACPDDL